MAKVADKYFEVDEWKLIEKGFNPNYGEVAESVFSLGNEFMGVRGYFDEGYSGKKLIGSYFNGVYEKTKTDRGHYKGIIDFSEYMVNSVDWLYTRITLDGEQLDLAEAKIKDFSRELDFKTGLLKRSFVWITNSGKETEISFERLVSMTDVHYAGQKITFKALNYDGDIQVVSGLDFTTIHQGQKRNMWKELEKEGSAEEGKLSIKARTIHTKQQVWSNCLIKVDSKKATLVEEDKKIAIEYTVSLKKKKATTLTKAVSNYAKEFNEEVKFVSFNNLEKRNVEWWADTWNRSDIVIEGDAENQQGIRFCIFQMFQTYHGAVKGTNIGAKGLTGEAYNGNAFWDTETYCLPFFLFNDQEAAKNLLYFRYKTLDEARERAKALDCKGAFYPIATISGKECCNLWQHASLQLQASTGVAYGVWVYEKMFEDMDFLKEYGLEMLVEVSRMLATRGEYSQDGKYGYYCVMGPDEFQMMVNNNCYTNYMGKFSIDYTLDVIKRVKAADPAAYKKVVKKLGLEDTEIKEWKNISKKMYIPYDKKTKLYEQHEGFFSLPHIDVDKIPVTDFPLYSHWSYDRIYRNDMVKQPDVLMFMLLFNSSFSLEELEANYDYYEPRCIHESSLSPSVHSILAAQLKKHDEAYKFFEFATRMDIDNYNRNTREGLHTTSIAAAWMNIIYGFGGLRSDGDMLTLEPCIPKQWKKYSFKITYKGAVIDVCVTSKSVTISSTNENEVVIKVYGQEVKLCNNEYTFKTQM